jgi:hypothetical protein
MKQSVFKRGRAQDWTTERIGQLSVQDIKQLRANAERLDEPGLVALCSDALSGKARRRPQADARRGTGPGTAARKLIARAKAFGARGVQLQDPRTSWGGVRKPDGTVVLALWAEAIESAEGGCRYLLWASNAAGARPWSDTPAGRERLEHCKRAIELGRAEGLLVYGKPLEGRLPEDKASAIYGIDAETVVLFEVEARGEEFWAVWGRSVTASPAGQSPPVPQELPAQLPAHT